MLKFDCMNIETTMNTDSFKEPKMKRSHSRKDYEPWSPSKKKRIKDNFLNFCDIVLSYTQYETIRHDNFQEIRNLNNSSPLDSGGSTADSYSSDNALSSPYPNTDDEQGSPPGPHNHHPQFGNRVNHGPNSNMDTIDVTGVDDDSYDLVTCYCRKPYAGRPMIECSNCLTWLHLTCAKVRKNNIPETFVCERCKDTENNNKQQQFSPTAMKTPLTHHSNKKRHRKSSSRYSPSGGSSPRRGNGNSNTSPVLSINSPSSGYSSRSSINSSVNSKPQHPNHQYHRKSPVVIPSPLSSPASSSSSVLSSSLNHHQTSSSIPVQHQQQHYKLQNEENGRWGLASGKEHSGLNSSSSPYKQHGMATASMV